MSATTLARLKDIDMKLDEFKRANERPDDTLIKSKVHYEKLKYRETSPEEGDHPIRERNVREPSRHATAAMQAILGYQPTPDKLLPWSTIKRRKAITYTKDQMFVYDRMEPVFKRVEVTVPYPIDIVGYFPKQGNLLAKVDYMQFGDEMHHGSPRYILYLQDLEDEGYLKESADDDAQKGGQNSGGFWAGLRNLGGLVGQ